MKSKATLYYIHDPMCSWCWAFVPVWRKIRLKLPADITVKYLLGGLAPDNDSEMPLALQQQIQRYWRNIEQKVPGTQFNFDFWDECTPIRSTYPACRAVIAARKQHTRAEAEMILAIQEAYYLHAQNPSLEETLLNLARQLKLDVKRFKQDLNSTHTQLQLESEIRLSRKLSGQGFPDLVLKTHRKDKVLYFPVAVDYLSYKTSLTIIQTALQ